MAFAHPDPKRIEADERRIAQRAADDLADIERERRIKMEIRACYFDGTTELNGVPVIGHSPKQLKFAGKMLRYANDGAARIEQAENAGIACWENIGRSRGGKRKGNLYRCLVQ